MEYLRVDHANHLLGLRLNDWTCPVVFTGAVLFLLKRRRADGRSGSIATEAHDVVTHR